MFRYRRFCNAALNSHNTPAGLFQTLYQTDRKNGERSYRRNKISIPSGSPFLDWSESSIPDASCAQDITTGRLKIAQSLLKEAGSRQVTLARLHYESFLISGGCLQVNGSSIFTWRGIQRKYGLRKPPIFEPRAFESINIWCPYLRTN